MSIDLKVLQTPDVIRFIIIVTKIAQDTTKTQAFNYW